MAGVEEPEELRCVDSAIASVIEDIDSALILKDFKILFTTPAKIVYAHLLLVPAFCFAVWKNHHMRTVTNYFIVNLSFADILVTITCLPASLVVDITETWFFGQTLCKILPYLQTISVSVSVLTLSCIAQDRWYAICHPLKFKSTAKRARKSIILIWLVSCVIMIPQAIVMECSSLLPELTNKTSLFTVCDEQWAVRSEHASVVPRSDLTNRMLRAVGHSGVLEIPGTSSVLQRKWKSLQCSAHAVGSGESVKVRTSTVSAEIKQVKARRKTARMLMVVLFVFVLCYLPISVLNIMKRVFGAFKNTNNRETVYAWFTFSHWLIYANSAANPIIYNFLSGKVFGAFKNTNNRETVYAWFTFSHWLIYANSAANPIIYNFLSGKFREEFKAAFICHCSGGDDIHKERVRVRTSTDSRKSLSTQVTNFDNISRISDQAV
ncbi:Orexin receptor type 2 [Anabarilius grahami]|uniref:Orexin receptor type 2 n=1 Tax=Anabarilius grahami TaxID=495550 RepID=A0A3N0YDG6_ANAGA|nr:Orexin receptor type 2 [Anabarilius grahami]